MTIQAIVCWGARSRVALTVLALVAAVSGARFAHAQTPTSFLAGPWDGAVEVSGSMFPVRVVFTQTTAGWRGTADLPQMGVTGLPLASLRIEGELVRFELNMGTPALFDGRVQGPAMTGTFTQGGATGTFSLARAGVTAAAAPATPAPPPSAPVPPPPAPVVRTAPSASPSPARPATDLPYREVDLRVPNGDVSLAGTLSLPVGDGPFPAVVLITGSGPQNRDEEVVGFRIFGVIADQLARRGIAVYRYDDRGVGGSSGSLATSTTMDFAGDVTAIFARLAARPEIDPRRIGLLGHSEGGAVAAMVAAANQNVAFVVLMAPPGLRTDELLRQQAADDARASGAGESAVVRIMAAHRRATEAARTGASVETLTSAVKALLAAQYDGLPAAQRAVLGERDTFVDLNYRPAVTQLSSPQMRAMLDFNPLTSMRQVRCPALVLFGSLDRQVPPALNQAPVRTAFAGNPNATVKVHDRANHLFQAATTGLVSEYATLPKAFLPGFLDEISTWISAVVRR
jgi:pimeloyl-ACP methyl ester carboxylesterase